MIAGDMIRDNLGRLWWDKASVIAHIDPFTWYHVHDDEELPDLPCTIELSLLEETK